MRSYNGHKTSTLPSPLAITFLLIEAYYKRYNKWPEHTTDEWLLTEIEKYDRMELIERLEQEELMYEC